MHEFGDVLGIGVVGLYIFVEAVDDEVDEGGLFLSEVDDVDAQGGIGADADDDVLDEVVAVAEAFVLEELSPALPDFDGEGVVGTDGVLDFPLQLYLFLLLLLHQQELLLQSLLQLAQDRPAVLFSQHQ